MNCQTLKLNYNLLYINEYTKEYHIYIIFNNDIVKYNIYMYV